MTQQQQTETVQIRQKMVKIELLENRLRNEDVVLEMTMIKPYI